MKPKHLAALITIGSLILVAVHLVWPNLNIDGTTLGLLAFAVLPWLRSIVKSVELPGIGKFEYQDYAQSHTETVASPPGEVQLAINAASLQPPHSPDARKVLKTLCHYQNQLFPNELHKRWTFAVGPRAPDYAAYLRGVAELVTAGLVAVSSENGQSLLTNTGLAYCKDHGDELAQTDMYVF